jgi:ribosomal protein S18 acetylase RimI-like enzyme
VNHSIRPATADDHAAIWRVLEPTIRAGETLSLPRDLSEKDALIGWFGPGHSVFVAEDAGRVSGTYFLRANPHVRGDQVANAAYVTAPEMRGRGIARCMAEHSFEEARQRGFTAMQFNYVISSNASAIRLWESLGFATVRRLVGGFRHPRLGLIDALVMVRPL